MSKTAVGLMAKYPELGKVKTRLAADIGDPGALRVYTQLLQGVSEKLRRLDSERFHSVVFVAQERMVERFRAQYPGADNYRAQVDGDLGGRMQAAFEELFSNSDASQALLIGADIPDLSAELVVEAADALEKHDVVLGPTNDGGYYLIGLQEVIPELFKGIEWSTETVFDKSRARIKELGLRLHLLEKLSDLDTLNDVHKLSRSNAALISTLSEYISDAK